MANWDSEQYLKFQRERTKAAVDLACRINITPKSIIDIGCGPGNSSRILEEKFPEADILGIDSSENMLIKARQSCPRLDFMLCNAGTELCDIRKSFDLVFSNACIQWIPEHKTLLKNMFSLLHEGGMLAVQLPITDEAPMYRILSEISTSEKWSVKLKEKLFKPTFFHTLSPEEYFDILSEMTGDFDIWTTTYFHIMDCYEDIIEWYKGTGLRPYLNALFEEDKPEFIRELLQRLPTAYRKQGNGKIILKFPRLFFTAKKL